MKPRFRFITLAAVIALAVVATSAIHTQSSNTSTSPSPKPERLTGKMTSFNYFLGPPWQCSPQVPASGGHAALSEAVIVSYESIPVKVVHMHAASPQWTADFYFGFDEKSNTFYMSEAGNHGGAMRETSADGNTNSGSSINPGGALVVVRDTMKRESDNAYSVISVMTSNGIDQTRTVRCTS
jgi:hypothetical protein